MEFSTFMIITVPFVILLVFLARFTERSRIENVKKEIEKKLDSLDDFSATQKIISNSRLSALDDEVWTGIAVDEVRKKACLIKQKNSLGEQSKEGLQADVISYGDILSSEISEDGTTVTRTSRGSQLGGALIGGLALGSAGAIIGGLSGVTHSSDKIDNIDLLITVNRTSNPIHKINFLSSGETPIYKRSIEYKSSMESVRHWHGLMKVIINLADLEDAAKEKEKTVAKVSVVDDLRELSELRKQGFLTDEEFATQKTKLLS